MYRFLHRKIKKFHVSEVFLKKEERIESLSMIMVLCLLVYAYAEWKLREKLKETGHSVPNQLKKPTQKPTVRWVFYNFMRVTQIIVTDGRRVISQEVKLNNTQDLILRLLGQDYKKYYGMKC